ncbi:hypothetical protein HanHA300_Chr03g0083091 [Helianthus annuus]|nr:hypothetical protein HanHA300_Chr03g0083091 [Helianthus annuus]KAJ0599782.1 hypothetical protein HanIR_Chr03g0108921 [Helianthus annuus]KAJ0607262.1 hypothetical protein HanHA89_Chr03g0094591 [Helianthus annuus]KAJ0767322.1 hypothetical protein HanLR1_Chr03g0087891 [Helianthus annuus]KAJ0773165.1 hypothetical protein HanOQP8_Chr03g0095891 [Helianthus annuus]
MQSIFFSGLLAKQYGLPTKENISSSTNLRIWRKWLGTAGSENKKGIHLLRGDSKSETKRRHLVVW